MVKVPQGKLGAHSPLRPDEKLENALRGTAQPPALRNQPFAWPFLSASGQGKKSIGCYVTHSFLMYLFFCIYIFITALMRYNLHLINSLNVSAQFNER